jgi:DNA-binding PadR family transcriptional regulator
MRMLTSTLGAEPYVKMTALLKADKAIYLTTTEGGLGAMGIEGITVPVTNNLPSSVALARITILRECHGYHPPCRLTVAFTEGSSPLAVLTLNTLVSVMEALAWEPVEVDKLYYIGPGGVEEIPLRMKPIVNLVELGRPAYIILKMIADGHVYAKKIWEEYSKSIELVSKQFINNQLNKLVRSGLVEMQGSGSNYTYTLTPVGFMIAGKPRLESVGAN